MLVLFRNAQEKLLKKSGQTFKELHTAISGQVLRTSEGGVATLKGEFCQDTELAASAL